MEQSHKSQKSALATKRLDLLRARFQSLGLSPSGDVGSSDSPLALEHETQETSISRSQVRWSQLRRAIVLNKDPTTAAASSAEEESKEELSAQDEDDRLTKFWAGLQPPAEQYATLHQVADDEEFPEYASAFALAAEDVAVSVSKIPEQALLHEKERLEARLFEQRELAVSAIARKESDLVWREHLARQRIETLEKTARDNIALEREKAERWLLQREKGLGRSFRRTRESLEAEVRRHNSALVEEFGHLASAANNNAHSSVAARTMRLRSSCLPQPVEVRVHLLRAIKDKLPRGAYVLMLSQYESLGGQPLAWSRQTVNGIGPCFPSTTAAVKHQGRYFDKMLKFEDSVFALAPAAQQLKPGCCLVLELFEASSRTNALDKCVAWAALPLCTEHFTIPEGKFKLAFLKGAHSPLVQNYKDAERAMAADLDNWLCNGYIEVRCFPLHDVLSSLRARSDAAETLLRSDGVRVEYDYLNKTLSSTAAQGKDRGGGGDDAGGAKEEGITDKLEQLHDAGAAGALTAKKRARRTAVGVLGSVVDSLLIGLGKQPPVRTAKDNDEAEDGEDPPPHVVKEGLLALPGEGDGGGGGGAGGEQGHRGQRLLESMDGSRGGGLLKQRSKPVPKPSTATATSLGNAFLSFLRPLRSSKKRPTPTSSSTKYAVQSLDDDEEAVHAFRPEDDLASLKAASVSRASEDAHDDPSLKLGSGAGAGAGAEAEALDAGEDRVFERGYRGEDELFLHAEQRGKLAGVEAVRQPEARLWAAAGLEGGVVRRLQSDGIRLDTEATSSNPALLRERQNQGQQWDVLDNPRALERYTPSLVSSPSARKRLLPGAVAAFKLRFLAFEAFGDLLPGMWGSLDTLVTVFVLLASFWLRLYLHYLGEYVYLTGSGAPVFAFQMQALQISFKYMSASLSQAAEVGLVAIGPITNNLFFLTFALVGVFVKVLAGFCPAGYSKFVSCFGIVTLLDPLLIVIVDLAYHNYDCGALSSVCTTDYTSPQCQCFVGDAIKLWDRTVRDEGSGISGLLLTLIIYCVNSVVSCFVLFEYLVHVHRNARILDIWRRISAPPEEFFLPEDFELSHEELVSICKRAESWRGPGGTRRRVVVHNYTERDASDSAYEQTTSHVAVYEVTPEGKPLKLWRQFLKSGLDGSIVETFGPLTLGVGKGEAEGVTGGGGDTAAVSPDELPVKSSAAAQGAVDVTKVEALEKRTWRKFFQGLETF